MYRERTEPGGCYGRQIERERADNACFTTSNGSTRTHDSTHGRANLNARSVESKQHPILNIRSGAELAHAR
jgi:hypothetical protein